MAMFSATVIHSIRPRSWWMKEMAPRLRGRIEGAAVERISPASRLIDAGQHLDEGRLAGAVLAQQREDLATDRDRGDGIDGKRSTEGFRHGVQREYGPGSRARQSVRSIRCAHALFLAYDMRRHAALFILT